MRATGRIRPPGLGDLAFASGHDLVFDYGLPLPGHANGLILRAFDRQGNPLSDPALLIRLAAGSSEPPKN